MSPTVLGIAIVLPTLIGAHRFALGYYHEGNSRVQAVSDAVQLALTVLVVELVTLVLIVLVRSTEVTL